MYINITDSLTANNKGSSGGLVNYLEKENRLLNKNEPEYWFNYMAENIEPYEVRQAIDNNIAKLCKADAKFFLININPSQKELKYLMAEFGEYEIKDQLKVFAEKVMDNYAKNFKREGISSAKDLLWFGKIEHNRYYGYKDKEVINGEKKRGELKGGNQMHIQIIVSRKDVTNKVKLSPMNTSRGKNQQHSKKLGQFNRLAFKQSGEVLFDQLFGFDRKLNETLAFTNIQKNGSLAQKEQLDLLEFGVSQYNGTNPLAKKLAREVSMGLFNSTDEMLQGIGKTVSGFIEIMMDPVYMPALGSDAPHHAEKKRRKKRKGQSQGISR
ncbi:molybdopterin-guanine dinucleotide biosynthesis protein MobB [Pedobacter sp. KBW01]|uniref:DUF5712 family protein n=1 Tax=Pedobacter sp. KBW01 TaxID=2153364 RepID=UPI000F59016A|nr:DUF5712 family protein [Pedobacter sp. KBW01]RQO65484.1 molybdopterin-guanine dinucleotide biosynthesis protein MobB [Pedobacter sp. KBW01]